MAPIRMDMSNVQSDFELVPDGDYPAHIFNVEETVTKGGNAPGTPMLKIRYKLDGGVGSVFDNIVLNAASAWKFKQLCVAAGIPDDRLGADAEIEITELQGCPVIVTVGHEAATDTYKAKNTVAKVANPSTYSGPAQASGNDW